MKADVAGDGEEARPQMTETKGSSPQEWALRWRSPAGACVAACAQVKAVISRQKQPFPLQSAIQNISKIKR